MNFIKIISRTLILFVACTCAEVSAETGSVEKQRVHRPKIGLVLEGGGALGFAHVGVLRMLEEHRVPIDFVAGTSMGSIVGAAYASGLSISEMEKALSETDWDKLFGERIARGDLTYRLKSGRGRELYGEAKVGFSNGKLSTINGLVSGQNVLPLLQRLFGGLASPMEFDSLPLPFRAVAADLETGETVIPERGDLATVVRASMSVPGFFSPVEVDGRLLVDGGIVNNLPIDVVRNMGADIVIVSVLDDELAKRDALNNPVDILGQMLSLLLQQNSDRSRKTLMPDDVLIPVDVKGYTPGDFNKSIEIMEKGKIAATATLPSLDRYSVTEEEYLKYRQKRSRVEQPPERIEFVRIVNNSGITDERILKQVRLKAGDNFDMDSIEEDMHKIYGTGYFTSVRYNLVRENSKMGIEVNAQGKDWLMRSLRLGFALEDNFEGDNSFRFGAAYRHYNLTTRGSYAEGQFEVGKNPSVGLELFHPIGDDSPYFISPLVNVGLTSLNVRNNGENIANYDVTERVATLALGRELSSLGEVTLGVTRGTGSLERNIGDPTLQDFDYEIGETYARVEVDTADSPDFPTTGYLGRLEYNSSLDGLGADAEFETLSAAGSLPITFDRTTFIFSGEFASTSGTRPVERSFGLGGFLDISGFQQGAVVASDYFKGRLITYHRFSEISNPLFDLGFFGGASLEITSAYSDTPTFGDQTGIFSGSVFVGADTPLLPTYLAFGINDEHENSLYLLIGRLGLTSR